MEQVHFADGRVDHSKFKRIRQISEWSNELSLRSKLTSESRVRTLGRFCADTGLGPDDLVRRAKARPESFRKLLADYAAAQKGRGRTAIYVRKVFDVVRAWLDYRGVQFRGFPKLGARAGESIEDEATPTPDDLRLLLGALSPRGRLCALLMAHAGLRPGVLGNVDGTDGLRLGDLEDLDLSSYKFKRVPFLIRVRSSRSKNEKGYLTFGGPELAEALHVDLRRRQADGEQFSLDSPVVASRGAGVGRDLSSPKGKGDFVTSKSITWELRKAIRRVRPGGQIFRPYALRSYFSSQLFAAEARGFMIRDAREAMLGHDLGVSGRYNLSKKLNPTLLEELRTLYTKAYPFLSTERIQSTSDDDLRRLFATEFLGISEAEVGKLGPLTNERIRDLAAARKRDEGTADQMVQPGSQKVVEVGAIETYIAKGWRFVTTLNGTTKVIVSAPD